MGLINKQIQNSLVIQQLTILHQISIINKQKS